MTYRFVQGIDYGPRKGTLGFAVHMAEGGDGTVGYLAQRGTESRAEWVTRVRGVSANFVILSTGEIVQMVGWSRASGSMNPRDRSTDKAFYGARFIKAVLGEHYVDPNAYSLSVEITGYRRNGPNAKQVDALVALVEESRRRFPTLRGAYGHADQTDTKGCPGTAATLRDAWARIGHGLFLPDSSTEDEVLYSVPGVITAEAPAGTPHYPTATATTPKGLTSATRRYLLVAQDRKDSPTRYLVDGSGDAPAGVMSWIKASALTKRRDELDHAYIRGRDAAVAAAQAVKP